MLHRKMNGAIIHYETRNANSTTLLDTIEGRMSVAQLEKLLKMASMFAYVYQFKIRMVEQLRFYLSAIGTGGHYINFGHG